MQVTFTRAGASRVLAEVIGDDGAPRFHQKIDLTSAAGQKRLLNVVPISLPELIQEYKQTPDDPDDSHTFEVSTSTTPTGQFSIYLRGKMQPLTDARVITGPDPRAAIHDALKVADYPAAEPLMQWEGTERLTCLDIDYHTLPYYDRPTVGRLESIAAGLQPRPVAGHVSHGRGYKAYYVAEGAFAADELAACAGLQWRAADGRATFEVKRESRHPAYTRPYPSEVSDRPIGVERCGPVATSTQSLDLPAVAAWLGRGLDEEARDEWLAERGYALGQTLPHSACPIAPHVVSTHGTAVFVGETALYCHKCAGEHRTLGRRRAPGVVPYSALVGGIDSKVYDLIKKLVHWPHAKHVLAYEVGGAPEPILRLAYRAALKLIHPADPRIGNCFEKAPNLVYTRGGWLLDEMTTLDRTIGKTKIAELPAAKTATRQIDGSYKVETCVATVDDLRHGGNDMEKYGFTPLTPIRGCRIWGEYLQYPDKMIPFLAGEGKNPSAPKYLRPDARGITVDEAWGRLEEYYPGLNRNYVTLLIAAKGIAEGGGDTPKILTTGASGAGKSLQVEIAGAIVGDKPGEVPWTDDTARLRQAIMDAAEGSDTIRVDEAVKDAGAGRKASQRAFDWALTLTPHSKAWKMFKGPASIGRHVVLVITDISVPPAIMRDKQLGRRFAHVPLARMAPDWRRIAGEQGLAEPEHMRTHSRELAEACDVILSSIIDEYFRSPTTFKAIVHNLGFRMVEESDEAGEGTDTLRQLFDRVCDAPEPTGADAKQYKGRGWKVITRDYTASDEMSETWAELADDLNDGWTTSRKCAEVDWTLVIGGEDRSGCVAPAGVAVDLDIRSRGRKMFVRFRAGPFKTPYLINEELTRATGRESA